MDHSQHEAQPAPPAEQPMDHSQHGAQPAPPVGAPVDHSQHGAPQAGHQAHEMEMTGALGPYPMAREASGTAWQPDTSARMAACT